MICEYNILLALPKMRVLAYFCRQIFVNNLPSIVKADYFADISRNNRDSWKYLFQHRSILLDKSAS